MKYLLIIHICRLYIASDRTNETMIYLQFDISIICFLNNLIYYLKISDSIVGFRFGREIKFILRKIVTGNDCDIDWIRLRKNTLSLPSQ